MIQRRTLVKAVIAALAPLSMTSAFAAGGPSGAHIGYQHQGQLGAVDMNPYKIAPLTAIIRDAGFTIQNIHVRIVPKANGQEIAYKVTNQKAKTYGGIPVFGLYPDYVNTVEVSYTKVAGDKREEIKESYRIYAPPVYFYATGARDQKNMDMNPEVKKVDPEFKDRFTSSTTKSSIHGKQDNSPGTTLRAELSNGAAALKTQLLTPLVKCVGS